MNNKGHLFARETFNGESPVAIAMSELSCLYRPHPAIRETVIRSLKEGGLINPLIVVHRDTLGEKLGYYIEKEFVQFPNARWFVYTGNNRYWAARQLGYRSIDCIVCHDLKKLPKWEEQMYIHPRDYDKND